jgi:hypothetical protein
VVPRFVAWGHFAFLNRYFEKLSQSFQLLQRVLPE